MVESRFDVVTPEQFDELVARPIAGAPDVSPVSVRYRDLYLDTADEQLERRGITCRLRIGSDDTRVLTAFIGTPDDPAPPQRVESLVEPADPRLVVAGASAPARRLAALVDTRLLEVRLELQIERVVRVAHRDWLRRPAVRVLYDRIEVRTAPARRACHQLTVISNAPNQRHAGIASDLEGEAGLRPIAAGTRERAQLLLKWM